MDQILSLPLTLSYQAAIRRKIMLFFSAVTLLGILTISAIVVGSYGISLQDVFWTLLARVKGP